MSTQQAWDPTEHPRDGVGKFSDKLGTRPAAGSLSKPPAPAQDATECSDPEVRRVYRIPTSRLIALQLKLDKANRRLAKAGVSEKFTYTARPRIVHDERTGLSHETNDVTINTPRISIGDWQFDSMHEQAANGKILSHYAGDTDPHVVDTMRCDYCGHNRARTKVYLVSSPATGELKQVGSNCLELFLGVKPGGIWALDEDFDAAELDVDDDDLGQMYGHDTTITPGDNVMLLTMRQVDQDGGIFVSRGRASIYEVATADKVLDTIGNGGAVGALTPSDEEADELTRLYAWVDSLEGESEYERNLQAALEPSTDLDGERWVSRKHVPLVASAVSSFRHHEQRARETAAREALKAREAAMKKEEFLAPTGTKLKDMGVTATILSARLGQDYGYGAPIHVKMLDDNGHVLYWRASGTLGDWIQTGDTEDEGVHWMPDAGSRVLITSGTVKDNRVSEYDGDWETVLTRTKLQPAPEVLQEFAREARKNADARETSRAAREAQYRTERRSRAEEIAQALEADGDHDGAAQARAAGEKGKYYV